MRFFQAKKNADDINDSNSQYHQGANENNSKSFELTNAVTAAGLTPSPEWLEFPTTEDFTQLAQALYISGVTGAAFIDSGTPDLYKLTPAGTLTMPPASIAYGPLKGAIVNFLAKSDNNEGAELEIGPVGGPYYDPKPIYDDTLLPAPIAEKQIKRGIRYPIYYDPDLDIDGAWRLIDYLPKQIKIIREEPNGTNGGSYEAPDEWPIVNLNTLIFDETFKLIFETIKPEFSLPVGTYLIEARASANGMGASRLRLIRTFPLPATPIVIGLNGGGKGLEANSDAKLIAKFSVQSISERYALQIYGRLWNVDDGALGEASYSGYSEIYADVLLTRKGPP